MKKFIGMILFVILACHVHAGGFYKWRDSNGVLHITDHPPDKAVEAEVDSETRINRSPMGSLGSGSPVRVQVQGQGHFQGQGQQAAKENKALQGTINSLESEIAYLESQTGVSTVSGQTRRLFPTIQHIIA